ncbi:thioredoxin family protein [Candidatus Ruminimicrobiellum ovillum]|uniref:thioredoxin family protein n=1 Tax=Candidatus Ruminimicrobiellum ovillum TaxID=1947927 RepID=UPI00355998E2
MKILSILGTGCPKCKKLYQNVEIAISNLENKKNYKIEKITDIMKIIKFNVVITPALAIDGNVISSGKVLSVEEIKEILK